jgi:pyruvate,water dikinase
MAGEVDLAWPSPVGTDASCAGPLIGLTDAAALDPRTAGAKAANLARAARAGMPIIPGFVLTTAGVATGLEDPAIADALLGAWTAASEGGTNALVVRSSSTIEDATASSMAGQFTSVVGVRTWSSFLDAVRRVIDSARLGGASSAGLPMAVLVQRELDATVSGVMFSVDPVMANARHVVVEAVRGNPDRLVGGRATAAHFVLSRRGRLLESVRAGDLRLARRQRRALARLAGRARRAFGRAQDIEWAIDGTGRLWLLQSRPVTATGERALTSMLFGPGPVAETFPAPLSPLEADLWVPPLGEGIRRALAVTGAVGSKRIARSPVVTTVGGWAAVDLELLGVAPRRHTMLHVLNPVPSARRVGAAWRVGRLRTALPVLAGDVVASVDEHLRAVPALSALPAAELAELLDRARRELASVHTLELLAGMLLFHESGASAPAVALHALATSRASGQDDRRTIEEHPVVLALVPPSLASPVLPATPTFVPGPAPELADLSARDALRLRTRWLQELTGRLARELGARAVDGGRVASEALVCELTVDELTEIARGGPVPEDLPSRATAAGPPLPSAFRISESGRPIAARARGQHADGVPASGGRTVGTARHRVLPGAHAGDVVLVVRDLDPTLAALLPSIRGLVAENGSALSHLAILAREFGVPTVVGVDGARRRFPPGTQLLVDGTSGEVTPVEKDGAA